MAYASKYARSSNYWKNSIRMNKVIVRLDVITKKNINKANLQIGLTLLPNEKRMYMATRSKILIPNNRNLYPYSKSLYNLREAFMGGVELPRLANTAKSIVKTIPLVFGKIKDQQFIQRLLS
ncbi:MAG: S46 family peptidase [Paludibacteraceae bacterium]